MGLSTLSFRSIRNIPPEPPPDGEHVAVDGIDFAVQSGEVFGFLGPNGAGKTTTMRMIACVSPRTDGHLSVLGLDPQTHAAEIKARIGVVPQLDNLDLELSVWDNLIIYGRYFGLPRAVVRARAEELLRFAQLTDRRDDRVDPLSGGMKRRLTIARGLLNRVVTRVYFPEEEAANEADPVLRAVPDPARRATGPQRLVRRRC